MKRLTINYYNLRQNKEGKKVFDGKSQCLQSILFFPKETSDDKIREFVEQLENANLVYIDLYEIEEGAE